MAWNPYTVLGLSTSASKNDAKAAYRKLAMEHHPDRGGNDARFKDIKAAWEAINNGWQATPEAPFRPNEAPYKSSFGDPPGTVRPPPRPQQKPPMAGKPAPGYEAKGPRQLPHTYRSSGSSHNRESYSVDLEITTKQGFEGCVVPFVHKGVVLEFTARPGTMMYDAPETFLIDEMIGASRGSVTIYVHLRAKDPKPEPPPKEQQTGDHHVTFRICALGLFSGGNIETRDYLNESVSVSIPSGYDPSVPIVVKGKGYGPKDKRGDLIVKIEPVFKAPSALNSKELKMLERLNEMTK